MTEQHNMSVNNGAFARHLSPLTQKQIMAQIRRQAAPETEEEADPSYGGHFAGIHPEHRPSLSADDELEEDEQYYTTRLPTSARRYQGYDLSPEHVYQSGNTRFHLHYVEVPPRRSRHQQLPPPGKRSRNGGATNAAQVTRARRRVHPLAYIGVSMLVMIAVFLVLSSALTWIGQEKDDLVYGRPRTFQIDAVVGHNDSSGNPSHFIALNLNRHVEVIEIPGGDTTAMKVYQITTLLGDGEDLTPVTLSFRDVTGDGKPDMLIHIQEQTLVLVNDHGGFRAARPGEVTGLI